MDLELSNFILHKEILLIHAAIDQSDYIFTVKWKTPQNQKGGSWELKSYLNHSTGEKDLTAEQIEAFLDRINPKWDWEQDEQQLIKAMEEEKKK